MKIGIIKERKIPGDERVPLNPEQCAFIKKEFGQEIVVEKSLHRCFSDREYEKAGVQLVDDVTDCDVLLGVKEVPIDHLIPNTSYFFFSHTYKKQPYNRGLLQSILKKNIRLIDYELLKDKKGKRLIAFGFFAGMVGAHNALYTYGQRTGEFALGRMKDAFDYAEVRDNYKKYQWSPVKIVLTGKGRVGQGAAKVLNDMGIKAVNPDEFLKEEFDEAVYTVIDFDRYARKKDGREFSAAEFFANPEMFESAFEPFTHVADIMINGIYWDNNAPAFFTKEEMKSGLFNLKVIADVTCDIAPVASIPSTLRATTIADPVFGYDAKEEVEVAPFQEGTIDMMTIDNLPNELPRDASTSFGEQFIEYIFPLIRSELFDKGVLLQATIARDGELGPDYQYLKDYVEGGNSKSDN
ncbi:NAD(P)-dependent oxidoreductase [Membranihabitans maritimus]|uniref:NAD(P)-dependent oxidoreductase n=1 Tax=Membranihabitans maritimus TaxID=2904244 RepID=UPI001F20B875|nr:NAD(P)-dependent oxidoreductase [Membranihabitans maritimus]